MENDDDPAPEFDLGNFLPYMLNQAAEAVSKSFQLHYQQDFGLSRTQWRILAHLYVQNGLTAKEIGARIHEDKVSISRGVAALESGGRLSRQPDSRDRRFEVLHLTPEGRELFAKLTKRAHAFEADLANVLGKESTEELRRVLMTVLPLLGGGKLDLREPETAGGIK
jgi:DNA-binding MarR family transcriptional regulator